MEKGRREVEATKGGIFTRGRIGEEEERRKRRKDRGEKAMGEEGV